MVFLLHLLWLTALGSRPLYYVYDTEMEGESDFSLPWLDLIKIRRIRADDRSAGVASAVGLSLISERCCRHRVDLRQFRAAMNKFPPPSLLLFVSLGGSTPDMFLLQLFLKAVMPTPRFNFIEHIFVFALFAEVV